jgi:hypothetical protein
MDAKVARCVKDTNTIDVDSVQKSAQTLKQEADYHVLKKGYTFLKRYRNERYNEGLLALPLRTCLKHHNSDRFSTLKVKTEPKWYTDLLLSNIDTETGELTDLSIYTTNEFKQGNSRKIKAIKLFCDYFQPLYEQRKVSMLFYTLTIAEHGAPIADVMNAFKKRCIRNGTPILGYVWISEVSPDLHWHYHIAIAINRINVSGKKLPEYLKLDNLWHVGTGVEFVRKNIQYYMSKYFAKNHFRMIANNLNGTPKIIRAYGKSIPKK